MKVLQAVPKEYVLFQKSYEKLDAEKKDFVDWVRKNFTTLADGDEIKILPRTEPKECPYKDVRLQGPTDKETK